WRTSSNESNYDGAWVFVKFRKKSSNLWQHGTLNYTSPGSAAASGHTEPAGSTIKTPADGKGVWIYRAANGTGTVNYTGAGLKWNYGVDGVLDNDSVEVRVFAVEMVYITTGSYYLGTGASETNCFKDGNTTNPFLVISEGVLNVANTAGSLNYNADNANSGDKTGPIPAAFPKGFNAFWIMKYECSQQQYADFLNNIDLARASARGTENFNGTHPNLIAPNPERAYANSSFADDAAFADWSATRPFTELEYEKACRGYNQMPTPNEYPWGNTTINQNVTVTNAGASNESASGNSNFYVAGSPYYLGRPVRCGAFANDTSDRVKSGATYYGVMEMGGNAWEIIIQVGNPAGRAFTNKNGDGKLDANGHADVTSWPNSDANNGWGFRGGGYNNDVTFLRTSDRTSAVVAGTAYESRNVYTVRVARTAE
ncbi:MAG: hypothetical protein JWQ09_2382, partial [Segetibacter sp.]|nr:hypothetical protein [Segetibacter sp.]